ncbi:unnamed protein product, partial [Prorocentrum cordatum]
APGALRLVPLFGGVPMRAVSYNPLSLRRRLRSEEISQELERHDIAALQGTQMKWSGGGGVSKQRAGSRYFFKKGFKVRELLSPPPALRGRGGGARLRRGALGAPVLALYFPVRGLAVQRAAAEALFTRAQRCLMETPARCTPLLCADLNDGLGMVKHEAGVCVPLSEAIGGVEPALEHESGAAWRRLCEGWGLATVNALYEGYTLSGTTGARSRPDAIAIPRELMQSVDPASRSTAQWDMDARAQAMKRHHGKAEFLRELEYQCEHLVRPHLEVEIGPDEARDELVETVREVGLAHFGVKARDTREMGEAAAQRKKLLQERAAIRRRHAIEGGAATSTEVEVERCVQELRDATRRLRALQRQQRRRLRTVRCEAPAEAERVGDAAAAWRLAHLLGERGKGARRRVHCTPRLEHTAAAPRQLFKGPGRLGGYAATELDSRPRLEQLRQPLARRCSVREAEEAAALDLKELEERLRRSEHPSMEAFREWLLHCLALVRAFQAAPLAWSRSREADIGRIIHVMRPIGTCYATVLTTRAEKEKAAPNDFGFVPRRRRPNRSRGGALVVTAVVAERAAHFGLAATASFKDLSKAFQCPSVGDMMRGLEGLVRVEDHPIVARRVLDYHCEVETAEGVLRMQTNQGVLIGDSIGPPLFLEVFTPVATEWAIEDSGRPDAQLLEAKSVVAGAVLDLSLAMFATDLCKRFVSWCHETAIKNHKASDELLDRLLEPRGFQQNISKQSAMRAFRGVGARAWTRAVFAGRLGARGNCSTVARYLGPMLHYQGGPATEIRARAAAATRGFADMGRFWKSETSVEVARQVFRSKVLGALLSGTAAVVPAQSFLASLGGGAALRLGRSALGARVLKGFLEEESYQHRAMPSQVVRQLLQMADIETELRAVRLGLMKCMVRHPGDHEMELTALFGQLPFALQPVLLVGDLKRLFHASERLDLLEVRGERPLVLLQGALREEVLQLDPRVLRVRGWAAQCPPSREVPAAVRHRWWTLHGDPFRPAREPSGLIDIGDFEFACQEPCAEGLCGAAFCSERALLWRKISSRKYRAIESSLCASNQCGFCGTVLASRASAAQHVRFALARGYCRGGLARAAPKLLVPDDIRCPACGELPPALELHYSHFLSVHFAGRAKAAAEPRARRQQDEFEETMASMARLVLSHDLQIRDLESACYIAFKVPIDNDMIKKDAGNNYSNMFRGKSPTQHGLRPPLPYLVESAARSLASAAEVTGTDLEGPVKAFHAQVSDKEFTMSSFKYFKVKDMYDKTHARVCVAVGVPEVAATFKKAMIKVGSEELLGTAPPGGLHRSLQEWLGQR